MDKKDVLVDIIQREMPGFLKVDRIADLILQDRRLRIELLPNPHGYPQMWCGSAVDHGPHEFSEGPESFWCGGDGMGS